LLNISYKVQFETVRNGCDRFFNCREMNKLALKFCASNKRKFALIEKVIT